LPAAPVGGARDRRGHRHRTSPRPTVCRRVAPVAERTVLYASVG